MDRQQLTTIQRCELLHIRKYDTALPQQWVDAVTKQLFHQARGNHRDSIKYSPVGHFVWSYDTPGCFGFAQPITSTGMRMFFDLPSELSGAPC